MEFPVLFEVLRETVDVLNRADIPYMIGGGLASQVYGLRFSTDDIDVFVDATVAPEALRALAGAGFRTWVEDPVWLYKAVKRGVEVDIIYASSGVVHFSDQNIARGHEVELEGIRLQVMSPEDLFVTKALAANPATPRHLNDLVGLTQRYELDWNYIMKWSDRGPRRFLTALVHAHDAGGAIPSWVLVGLLRQLPDCTTAP